MRRTIAVLAAVLGLAAVASSQGAALTRAEYAAHKRQIESDFKADRSACDRLTDNDKEVCVARAAGHQKVARAELDFNNTGAVADAERLATAKADAELAVAREVCDARKVLERTRCAADAAATHARTLQDIALRRQGDPARSKPLPGT